MRCKPSLYRLLITLSQLAFHPISVLLCAETAPVRLAAELRALRGRLLCGALRGGVAHHGKGEGKPS